MVKSKTYDIKFWLILVVTMLIDVGMALITISEFINVSLFNQTLGYPFGGEGSTAWYYQSAGLYATVNLIFGLLFLTILAFCIWSILIKQKRILYFTFLATLLLLLIQLANSMVE